MANPLATGLKEVGRNVNSLSKDRGPFNNLLRVGGKFITMATCNLLVVTTTVGVLTAINSAKSLFSSKN